MPITARETADSEIIYCSCEGKGDVHCSGILMIYARITSVKSENPIPNERNIWPSTSIKSENLECVAEKVRR
ncbi:unnamed protein product [Litomosoides sigmodontis]|uniref:Uncharacterized protein n=1 Tax=Litomosoides sigmodontis TaxID=42156 RepID=A0A3P6S9N0_LITSI|nr:unnamed protein product [Litomosoides sigmodontis]